MQLKLNILHYFSTFCVVKFDHYSTIETKISLNSFPFCMKLSSSILANRTILAQWLTSHQCYHLYKISSSKMVSLFRSTYSYCYQFFSIFHVKSRLEVLSLLWQKESHAPLCHMPFQLKLHDLLRSSFELFQSYFHKSSWKTPRHKFSLQRLSRGIFDLFLSFIIFKFSNSRGLSYNDELAVRINSIVFLICAYWQLDQGENTDLSRQKRRSLSFIVFRTIAQLIIHKKWIRSYYCSIRQCSVQCAYTDNIIFFMLFWFISFPVKYYAFVWWPELNAICFIAFLLGK